MEIIGCFRIWKKSISIWCIISRRESFLSISAGALVFIFWRVCCRNYFIAFYQNIFSCWQNRIFILYIVVVVVVVFFTLYIIGLSFAGIYIVNDWKSVPVSASITRQPWLVDLQASARIWLHADYLISKH